jgi:hypothetical protein
MDQQTFLDGMELEGRSYTDLGASFVLEMIEEEKKACLYRDSTVIKTVDLSDKVAKRVFIVEVIEMGAMKSRLASALSMSRQTIDTYLDTKKHFGFEGLIHSYNTAHSKSMRKQRELHSQKLSQGNKAKQLTQIRRTEREKWDEGRLLFEFSFGPDEEAQRVEKKEQPFVEEHEWEATRYAGVFTYLITLVMEWRWLSLVMGHFGVDYKIFMVFLLMAACNIRSIEQLKNVRSREAGLVLGINRIPCKPKVWQWLYSAANKQISDVLLEDYFRYQIRAGLVGIWLWSTDGHLLPYTGKETVHYSYNTQRRMPVPGQTNLVTCDESGRIVDFTIQEGHGDLRGQIRTLAHKWEKELSERPVMVFDREGNGAGFFSGLVQDNISFVTWEKNADAKKLASLKEEEFTDEFEFKGKKYGVCEGEKSCNYVPKDSTTGKPDKSNKHSFTLRRIYIWNKTSGRRASGLAWNEGKEMSVIDCARAILSRWGASENTFKHINRRHPLHYHPGFKLVPSERQEVANPEVKKKQNLIARIQKKLNRLYKKLTKNPEVLNQDGKPRQNSQHEKLKNTIHRREAEVERLKEEKSVLPEKVDVSTLEDYKSFKQIDGEGKYLFDFVTSSVWNARKQMVDWLRPFFNQENELVDLFYAITDCHGWIKTTKTHVIVRLEPLQQPKRRVTQEQLCRKLSNLGAQTPTGKSLIIEVGASPL